MILVYTAPQLFMVAHVRNLLEMEGIACTLRNEYSASAAGRIPFTECWPEVWVTEDEAPRARALIAAIGEGAERGAGWRCAACGEAIEESFAQCWKCGALRPD